jgi:uncharacterized protein
LANQSVHGLITWATVVQAAVYLPALLAGVWIGARSFKGTDPETFRKYVLGILAFLAAIIFVKAAMQMM